MPVIVRLSTIKDIHQHPTLKETIIIIISAKAFPDDVGCSLSSGCQAHIAKPIHQQILLKILQEHIANTLALFNNACFSING